MTNLNVQEKSRGVVLFAFNTSTINYEKIAERSARLIKHILNLPVTIITEKDVDNTLKNFKNSDQLEWRNGDRYRAYNLSPYDETLLLDSDYLTLDDSLLKLFDQEFDYRLQHHNEMISVTNDFKMGVIGLPYVWATVVFFRKTVKAKLFFELVARIQHNYNYYRRLYHISSGSFRNDYAFAIANNILNGYDLGINQSIPWTMLTIDKNINAIEIKNSKLIIRQDDQAYVLSKQNIHIMDKQYLLSDSHEKFLDIVCKN